MKPLRAGDTWDLNWPVPSEYEGWKASFFLQENRISRFDGEVVNASVDMQIAAKRTRGFAAGDYQYVLRVEKDEVVKTLDEGFVDILPNPFQKEISTVEKTLRALEAALAKRATKTQEEYEVDGMRIKYLSLSELQDAIERYKKLWSQEKKRLNGKKGPFIRTVHARY